MKKALLLLAAATLSFNASAADYVIDNKGGHAFINFKVNHLGYSWLTGRFNTFTGKYSYDASDIQSTKIVIDIDTNSFDSNHAKRDKHIRSEDFLDTKKYGTAKFISTKVTDKGDNQLEVVGDLTLHGVTKSITIDAEKVGEGKDPWGNYRSGFAGSTALLLKDFDISDRLGPVSAQIFMDLHIEGIRQ